MAEQNINFGQAEIAAFSQAAQSGAIRYNQDVARDAANAYQNMIDGLIEIRQKLGLATQVSGFGGLESARQLERGFSKKAVDGIDVIEKLIEGAMRMREAYLRAGNLLTEADAQNAAMLRFVADSADSGGRQ